MNIAEFFSRTLDAMAIRFLPVEDLEEHRKDIETDLRDARLGCFTDNELVVADCNKQLAELDRELERRRGRA